MTGDEDIEDYKRVLSPTGTARSAPNTIHSLTAHLGEPAYDHPQYTQPTLTAEDLGAIADGLATRGAYEESARVEIERRHMVSRTDYAPLFTTYELTVIAIQLVGVQLEATLFDDTDCYRAVKHFATVIDDSDISPLDERYDGLEDQPLRHVEGDYLDPFRALTGVQTVVFELDGQPVTLNEDGDPTCDGTKVTRDDLPAIDAWGPNTRFFITNTPSFSKQN